MDSYQNDNPQDDRPGDGGGHGGGHGDVLQWLSRQLDGELPAREQVLLSDHLDGCPRCALVARDWQVAQRLMRDDAIASARRAPLGLADRIVARLKPLVPVAAAPAAQLEPEAAVVPLRALRRSAMLAASCLAALASIWFSTEPDQMSASSAVPALGSDDPALQRVLDRWQKGRDAAPSFFEMALPAGR